ncbi:MAG TPA: hypothetical protein VK421_01095 [Pyrinomonadaceae bacterium]|nr:hypothetical protein [Pyrinomonadaceae bacterium]
MTLAIASVVAAAVGLLLLVLLWRALKMVARLALIGLVVLAVLAGLVAWGWLGSGSDDARPQRRDNRRATNANSRR